MEEGKKKKKRKSNTIVSANLILERRNDTIIRVNFEDGSSKDYIGDCTVWHELPLFLKVDSSRENTLYHIQKYVEFWQCDFPNGHMEKLENYKLKTNEI